MGNCISCCTPQRDTLDNIENKCCGYSYFNCCDIFRSIAKLLANNSYGKS